MAAWALHAIPESTTAVSQHLQPTSIAATTIRILYQWRVVVTMIVACCSAFAVCALMAALKVLWTTVATVHSAIAFPKSVTSRIASTYFTHANASLHPGRTIAPCIAVAADAASPACRKLTKPTTCAAEPSTPPEGSFTVLQLGWCEAGWSLGSPGWVANVLCHHPHAPPRTHMLTTMHHACMIS
jgi:hypothetical protein